MIKGDTKSLDYGSYSSVLKGVSVFVLVWGGGVTIFDGSFGRTALQAYQGRDETQAPTVSLKPKKFPLFYSVLNPLPPLHNDPPTPGSMYDGVVLEGVIIWGGVEMFIHRRSE